MDNVDNLKHDIIREALKLTGVTQGVEVVYISDLPLRNTGLGSSSSLAVGVLNALYAYKNKKVGVKRLAEEACKIEIEILKRPIGKQDQYAAAFGGLNYIRFNKDESVEVKPIIFNKDLFHKFNRIFLIFYTGRVVKSGRILVEQKDKTSKNFSVLDEMVKFTKDFYWNLKKGKLDVVGDLLHRNWLHKQKLASQITNKTIDVYYEKAIKAGAAGGKILGSGGGGFLLLCCKPDDKFKIRKELLNLKEMPFKLETQGSEIIYKSN
ncbi:MAG: GHMP kinase [Parcubacteria group bacterium Athens0714_26]|nr:MAG: GHMP kinase [Parcubacteria group bacterium Athens0714_26]